MIDAFPFVMLPVFIIGYNEQCFGGKEKTLRYSFGFPPFLYVITH